MSTHQPTRERPFEPPFEPTPEPTLHRAVAYLCHRFNTQPKLVQPEMHVFFEAAGDAPMVVAKLLRLLAQAWCCEPADIEFYNLWSERELLDKSLLDPTAGDARLLEIGHFQGPLFCRRMYTLMLVRPFTLMRLQRARQQAVWLDGHHSFVQGVAGTAQPNRLQVAQRAEYQALSVMGGLC